MEFHVAHEGAQDRLHLYLWEQDIFRGTSTYFTVEGGELVGHMIERGEAGRPFLTVSGRYWRAIEEAMGRLVAGGGTDQAFLKHLKTREARLTDVLVQLTLDAMGGKARIEVDPEAKPEEVHVEYDMRG